MTEHAPNALESLFNPASVAVIGASDDPAKWGYEYSRNVLATEQERQVFLVNQRGTPILGHDSYRSLTDLPVVPDVIVLCVPSAVVLPEIAKAADLGVRYAICITAGFSETGADGAALQDQLIKALQCGPTRLIGPNCIGVVDTHADFECNAFWKVPPGNIGLVSQSGSVLLDLSVRLVEERLGVSRAVSLGNQADLAIHDYFDALIEDPNTEIVVAYVEEFKDGRRLIENAKRVIASGKPVVLLVPHGAEAVQRAVRSHTGSMVSNDEIVDAACAAAGVIRVRSVDELFLTLRGLSCGLRSHGRRTAVVSDGGGFSVLGTGVASHGGLSVPAFSPALCDALRPLCSPGSNVANPIDYVGALNLDVVVPIADLIARSGEVDIVLMNGMFNNVTPDADDAAEAELGSALAARSATWPVPLVVSSPMTDEPALAAMVEANVPVFKSLDAAVRCIALVGSASDNQGALQPLPDAAAPLEAEPDYDQARAILEQWGIPFAAATRVESRQAATTAARQIGYPVALKAIGLEHKSDLGGVLLNLTDEIELCAAFDDLNDRLKPLAFSVEQMVDTHLGVEILVGGMWDQSFGPLVVVGMGGVMTEVMQDTVLAPAPLDHAKALSMISSLKGHKALGAFRGRPEADVARLADVVVAFSSFIAAHPEISEAEINPVIAGPTSAIAVDARIALSAD